MMQRYPVERKAYCCLILSFLSCTQQSCLQGPSNRISLGAGQTCNCGSVPSRGKRDFSFPKCSEGAWGPPSSLFSKYWRGGGALSLRVKRPECEADHARHLVQRLKKCDAIPPLCHTHTHFMWCAHGKLYIISWK